MVLLIAFSLALVLPGAAWAQDTPSPDDIAGVGFAPIDPPPATEAETDARALSLAKGLRCPVCQGLSVADSQSEAAVAMKGRIRELVSWGYSDEQVVDYFVARYGTWVLLEPPKEGVNWVIFLAPVVVVLAGLGVWGATVRGRARATAEADARRATTPEEPSVKEAPDDPYSQRILAELDD